MSRGVCHCVTGPPPGGRCAACGIMGPPVTPVVPQGLPRIQSAPRDDRVPAWAVMQMGSLAGWAGRWAGCADILALYLKRLEDDPDVTHALAEYRKLRDEWQSPTAALPSELS